MSQVGQNLLDPCQRLAYLPATWRVAKLPVDPRGPLGIENATTSGNPDQSGPLAQLVEQLTFNQWVAGSNPARLTTVFKELRGFATFAACSG